MTDPEPFPDGRPDDVLDAVDVGVVVLDLSGRVQNANRRAREILSDAGGSNAVDRLFAHALDLVDEDLVPVVADEQPGARTLRTGEPQTSVMYGLRSDTGAMRWFLAGTQP